MKTIRQNTFETNSSSTHSITIVTKNQYEDWKSGKVLFNKWKEEFVPVKVKDLFEIKKEYLIENSSELSNGYIYEGTYYGTFEELCAKVEIEEDTLKEFDEESDNNEFYTYDRYYDEIEYETYEEEYTTPSGDEIVAFGYYGSDY